MLPGSMMWKPRRLPSGDTCGYHQARAGASTGVSRPVRSTQSNVRGGNGSISVPYAIDPRGPTARSGFQPPRRPPPTETPSRADRKSTRLNSSHSQISYAVFCLKKKKKKHKTDSHFTTKHTYSNEHSIATPCN